MVLSHAFAAEKVERFTFRSSGHVNSYFYGYIKLLQLRKDTEAALGTKFNQKSLMTSYWRRDYFRRILYVKP